MTQERVDNFLLANQKYLPAEKIVYVKEKMLAMDDARFNSLMGVEFKDPTTLLLVSIFLGGLGVDRFMLGDNAMGVLKLLTAGLCGILWIIDLFSIQKKTKDLNFNNMMLLL